MVKEIPLQNGMVALVDDEDYERVSKYIWTVNTVRKTSYVVRNKTINVVLQRFILNTKSYESDVITFKNKNDLDFRKENLLITDVNGSSIRSKGSKNGTSKYKGVSWCKRSRKWLAQIQVKRKNVHLGYFTDENEAAKAYNEGAKIHFGENSFLNNIGEYNGTKNSVLKPSKKPRRINGTTSKYRGVSLNSEGNGFIAATNFKGKYFYLGTFHDEVRAAKAYDEKSYELRGDKAILNFPEDYQSMVKSS